MPMKGDRRSHKIFGGVSGKLGKNPILTPEVENSHIITNSNNGNNLEIISAPS